MLADDALVWIDGGLRPAAEARVHIADHGAPLIQAGLTREEEVRLLATGVGFLGSSLDYLRGIRDKFEELGVRDDEVVQLLVETEAYRAAL